MVSKHTFTHQDLLFITLTAVAKYSTMIVGKSGMDITSHVVTRFLSLSPAAGMGRDTALAQLNAAVQWGANVLRRRQSIFASLTVNSHCIHVVIGMLHAATIKISILPCMRVLVHESAIRYAIFWVYRRHRCLAVQQPREPLHLFRRH